MTVRPEAEVTVSVEAVPAMSAEEGRVSRIWNSVLWKDVRKEGRACPCPGERFPRTPPTSRDSSSWGLRQGRRVGS